MEWNIILFFNWFLKVKDVTSCYPDIKECCCLSTLISKLIIGLVLNLQGHTQMNVSIFARENNLFDN